jgi:hypothetical protein
MMLLWLSIILRNFFYSAMLEGITILLLAETLSMVFGVDLASFFSRSITF